jgi:hypothetical protein
MEAAKNAIVTAIQSKSCIILSSAGSGCRVAEIAGPLVRRRWNISFPVPETHLDEFCAPRAGTELRVVHPQRARRQALSFGRKSYEDTQQESHSAETQYCEGNLHNATGVPVAETIPAIIVSLRA